MQLCSKWVFFQAFLNPINLDLKINFKLVLEWSEHFFIVKNAKKSYQGSLFLLNFIFWTIKACFDYSKTIFKWNFWSKLMRFKKKVWKLVKLHRQCMCNSQQLSRGAAFQAMDNGGDRSCHFLGFTCIYPTSSCSIQMNFAQYKTYKVGSRYSIFILFHHTFPSHLVVNLRGGRGC